MKVNEVNQTIAPMGEVEIIIRPQAIKLSEEKTPVNGIKGTVMASKLMGSFSFIHL